MTITIKPTALVLSLIALGTGIYTLVSCTQESQNKISRAVQNWTGTNGVLEIYSGDKVMKRFMKIDKLTTAIATDGNTARPYRYGYGVLDTNLDGVANDNSKQIYFEFSDHSTNYVFFEQP
jgi:hypothetical protein